MSCGTASKEKVENKTKDMSANYTFLLGTYTNNPEQGIHLMAFDPEAEKFHLMASASEPTNPSFVTINEAKDRVYTVEETSGDTGGKISAFSLVNGGINFLNSVSAEGDSPCYITMDPTELFIIAGNYSSGNFSVIPLDTDGKLKKASQVIQHVGSSANPDRQKQPHVHSAIFHPNDGNLLVADLGTDEVNVYSFDSDQNKPVTPSPLFRLHVAPGAGPRHMVFNTAGDKLYLIHEISAEIGVYAYDKGELKHLSTHKLTGKDFEGKVGAAEVRLSPDEKFLYASNRGEANVLICFQIVENGELKHVQTISSAGASPRNFNITNDGKFLIVGNQNSNNIRAFERDLNSGTLKLTNAQFDIYRPVYINFLP
jgi:6-phosphogluconolactonase